MVRSSCRNSSKGSKLFLANFIGICLPFLGCTWVAPQIWNSLAEKSLMIRRSLLWRRLSSLPFLNPSSPGKRLFFGSSPNHLLEFDKIALDMLEDVWLHFGSTLQNSLKYLPAFWSGHFWGHQIGPLCKLCNAQLCFCRLQLLRRCRGLETSANLKTLGLVATNCSQLCDLALAWIGFYLKKNLGSSKSRWQKCQNIEHRCFLDRTLDWNHDVHRLRFEQIVGCFNRPWGRRALRALLKILFHLREGRCCRRKLWVLWSCHLRVFSSYKRGPWTFPKGSQRDLYGLVAHRMRASALSCFC